MGEVTARGKLSGRLGRASAAAAVALAMVLGSTTAAHAEGSFTSNMTQVQPTFHSRTWADKDVDSAHTVVVLSNCRGNAGGGKVGSATINSVTLKLESGASITKACGTYDFGRTAGTSFQRFTISSINGITASDSRKIFLNADVKVSY